MKPIDWIIIILFLPTIVFGAGYLYMYYNNLCGPLSSVFCLGFGWVAYVVVVPSIIFTFELGLFFFCRRCHTEEI